MRLYSSLQGDGTISESVARAVVRKPATWAWVYLIKRTLLSLGLHQSFTTFYLNLKAPTKALLSISDCQIIVAVGGYKQATSYSDFLPPSLQGLLIYTLENRLI